jgi:hypothetical protein
LPWWSGSTSGVQHPIKIKIKIFTVTHKKPPVLTGIPGIKDHPTIGIIQISVEECTKNSMESVFRQNNNSQELSVSHIFLGYKWYR